MRDVYPNKKWYIMIDDDTYIHLGNLLEHLSHYDPEEDYYMGGPRLFKNCGGVKEYSYAFAHGGSGIVISSSAMKKLYDGTPSCYEALKTCWAGDIMIGVCFHDHLNVSMKEMFNLFHGETPYGIGWNAWPYSPCERPLTFHHLLPQQISKLHALERSRATQHHPLGLINHADVVEEFYLSHAGNPPVGIEDVLMFYNDYDKRSITSSPAHCRDRCKNQVGCITWSWSKNEPQECRMGKGPPAVKFYEPFTSGLIPGRWVCSNESPTINALL